MTTSANKTYDAPFRVDTNLEAHDENERTLTVRLNFARRNATRMGEVWDKRSYDALNQFAGDVVDCQGVKIGRCERLVDLGANDFRMTVRIADERAFDDLLHGGWLRCAFWGRVTGTNRYNNGKTALRISPTSVVLWVTVDRGECQ